MSKEEIKRLIMIGVEIAKDNVSADITHIGPNTSYASYEFDDDTINQQIDEAVDLEF